LERWLYRLVRKHGGRQEYGWSFDLGHLHAKSGSLSPLKHFAYDLREIVRRQPLPGYRLTIEQPADSAERLLFAPIDPLPFVRVPRRRRAGTRAGDKL
jgi:plasmid replication initiation protein